MPSEAPDQGIRLTINGTEVTAGHGRLLIDGAEAYGVFVPRFCYHPGMDSVAACRGGMASLSTSASVPP